MTMPKVKPLRWTTGGDYTLGATVPWGMYVIEVDPEDSTQVQWLEGGDKVKEWIDADSAEAAKAACQAHYEAAVASCILLW